MSDFWDSRYNTDEYVYGLRPNRFFLTSSLPFSPFHNNLIYRDILISHTLFWGTQSLDCYI
ncbi:MAG: hypothetical protein PHG27_10930 [Massilibacteroides sp.]|nr:hypothetical protein [Massilibacteroides sp.]